MIYDSLTKRDIYMYNRGKLAEYIRSNPGLTPAEHTQLLDWIKRGNDIHSNPFGLYDEIRHRPVDYLDAARLLGSDPK